VVGGGITVTPGGYVFLNQWGSARYNTAAQLIALVYDKHHGDTPSKYANWARSQMDYLLGKNPLNRCYVVGYSSNSVKYPHHRAASGLKDANDSSPHKYVLYGALVGGPDASDQHVDRTNDYIYNELPLTIMPLLWEHVQVFTDSSGFFNADRPVNAVA